MWILAIFGFETARESSGPPRTKGDFTAGSSITITPWDRAPTLSLITLSLPPLVPAHRTRAAVVLRTSRASTGTAGSHQPRLAHCSALPFDPSLPPALLVYYFTRAILDASWETRHPAHPSCNRHPPHTYFSLSFNASFVFLSVLSRVCVSPALRTSCSCE